MAAKKVDKSDEPRLKARLDKWLWAARLYKTRAIAKQAVEGGKVYCEGLRAKPSKEIEEGMKLKLRAKFDEKAIIVKALSEKRLGAPGAKLLYEETPESISSRARLAEQRKAQPKHWPTPTKPTKKQRRILNRFKQRGAH
jgi:ribosome-associated heat shock protein Hsp15